MVSFRGGRVRLVEPPGTSLRAPLSPLLGQELTLEVAQVLQLLFVEACVFLRRLGLLEPALQLGDEGFEHGEPLLGSFVISAAIPIKPACRAPCTEVGEAEAKKIVPGLAADLEGRVLFTREREDGLGDASLRFEHMELIVGCARHELRLEPTVVVDGLVEGPLSIQRFNQEGVVRVRKLPSKLVDSFFFGNHIRSTVALRAVTSYICRIPTYSLA